MSISVTTSGKEALFATQTEAKPNKVRTLAAAIKREYEISDLSDRVKIIGVIDELVNMTAP